MGNQQQVSTRIVMTLFLCMMLLAVLAATQITSGSENVLCLDSQFCIEQRVTPMQEVKQEVRQGQGQEVKQLP